MKTRLFAAVVVGILLLSGCTAEPQPAPSESDADTAQLPEPATPLPLDELAAFSGVVMLNAGSNCTGTVVDTGVAAGPAYVLTNGHCVGDIGEPAQGTRVGVDWSGTAQFFRAAGNLGSTHDAQVVELAYSTMRHTDLAIARLDTTLGELEDLGVQPVAIADEEPAEGADVVNVGVPVQNLLDAEWVLRRGECTLGGQRTLLEFRWLWFGAWSNDCPGIVQGSSGSALFEVGGDGHPERIAAVINTTSWGAPAGGACWLNRPCEVTADGAVVVPRTSYAQSVAGIGRCFDPTTGEFSLGADCPLPTSDIWTEDGGGSFRGGDEPDSVGRLPEVSLAARTAGPARTALIPLGDGSGCADAATYASASTIDVPVAGEGWELAGRRMPVDLPTTEGAYLLCAVRGDAYAQAASVIFHVDRTPPILPAGAEVHSSSDGVIVQPHLNPPELSNVRFTWGPAGEVDCDDTATFQDFLIVPLTLGPDDLPAVYCIYGMDQAGNRTPVTRIDLPAP